MIRGTFIFVNVLLACFTLFSYVSPHIDPNSFYLFSFFGLLYPFLLIFNFLFILIWLFTKKRFVLISLLTILIGYGHMSSFMGFSSQKKANKSGFHICSFNAQKVKAIRNNTGSFVSEKKQKFISFLKREGIPNILCTQETSSNGHDLIKEEFEYQFVHRNKEGGITIFSKIPFGDTGEIDLKSDKASAAIWVDVLFPTDTMRIYNIHLRSNRISSPAEEMMKNPDLQNSKTWNSIKGILSNYKNSTKTRSKQANIIMEEISESPFKTIVCGDFNDTPLSYVYRVLSDKKKDSFKESGTGIGTTYAGVIPALRIDYILADERLDIIGHQIHKGKYSDHYPISAQIVFP